MRSQAREDATGGAPPQDLQVPDLLVSAGQLLGQGLVLLGRDGGVRWMNDVALRIHGLDGPPRDVAEYEEAFSFRSVADLMEEASPFSRVLRGESLDDAQYQVGSRSRRGGWRCRVRAQPVREPDGAVAGAIVVMEDVTEAHHDDEERKALYVRERLARAAAERERDFVQSIFESSPIPIMVLEGPEHRLAFLNQTARDLTGLAAHMGRTHAEVLPREHARVAPLLEGVYRKADEHARIETEYDLPKGPLTLQSHYVPLRGPGDRPIGVVWLAIDATARRSAERALESARRQLGASERLSALGALVSGVAHELRTPLAYIMNNLSLLQLRLARPVPPPPSELTPLLDHATEGVERIHRIVGELRRFGGPKPLRTTASLDEIVRPAIDLFKATHGGAAALSADLRPTARVEADELQIQQVALNLLQNAADAMPDGGAVRVWTEEAEGRARLCVQDQGPGIPERARGHVFDEFFTTKPGGTGLGLSIVRRIVEIHHGSVAFDTGDGGTTFVVELPTVGGEGSST